MEWIIVYAVLAFACAVVVPSGTRKEGRCRSCGYLLAGLPANSPCPECGDKTPELARVFRPTPRERRPVLGWITLAATITMVLAPVGARLALAYAYQRDGFQFGLAWRVIPIRELERWSWFELYGPLVTFLTFSPLFVLMVHRKKAMRLFAGGAVITFVWLMLMLCFS